MWDIPAACHLTQYLVIPSPTLVGALHEMTISFGETEFVESEDGWPGKPKNYHDKMI